MAKVVITLKIMPESPEVNWEHIEQAAVEHIDRFIGESAEKRTELEPIAFGLKALKLTFVMDENIGSTEDLEAEIGKLEGVNSVEVVDVRRAIG